MHVPGMAAKTRNHPGMGADEREHLRPVLLARTVDHHPNHSLADTDSDEFILPTAEAIVLKMVVSVVQAHAMAEVSEREGRMEVGA